jgi:D-lyxose ketol-isomerase
MKRSQINAIIKKSMAFLSDMNFKLPPFAYWSAGDWKTRGPEYDEIRENMLGWDVTDYGRGDFDNLGLVLFTIRNGNCKMSWKYKKPYAEKLVILEETQTSPLHFHWGKTEDLVNRGGGNLLVTVYMADENGGLSDRPVPVSTDGKNYTVPAGAALTLTPGESITFSPFQYHALSVERGTGKLLIGEVSSVNDDNSDNCFYEKLGRFPEIEEDEPVLYPLCNEYGKL